MAFCYKCKELLNTPVEKVKNIEHHRCSFSLFQAVDQGCPLCTIFKEALLHTCSVSQNISREEAILEQYRIEEKEEEQGLDCFDVSYYTVTAVGPSLSDNNDLKDGLFGLRYERYFGYSSQEYESKHAFITACPTDEQENTDAEFVHGRRIVNEPNLDVARGWIQTCQKQHSGQCSGNVSGWLPPRVIDVGATNAKIRLVEPSTMGSFIALSHRWGSQKPYLTTTVNYDRHLNHIDFDELPQTFRDAITITRDLGVKYLWIDCLCIKQDSLQDWAEQCVQMPTIYSKALLNLAGPQSPDPASGLLHDRSLPDIPAIDIEWATLKSTSPVKIRLLYQGLDYTLAGSWESILADRGWIYQERLLSQRILYLGRQIMYWECNTSRYYEPVAHVQVSERSQRGIPKKSFECIKGREALLEYWYRIMMQYHCCKLTVPEDKLPALSGIARRFHDLLGDEYVAGLWRRDFVQGLCWRVYLPMSWEKSQKDVDERDLSQTGFIAPSWSWASTRCAIEMQTIEQPDKDLGIIDATAKLTTEDAFGRISGAPLTISGRIHAITKVNSSYGITMQRKSNIDATWRPKWLGNVLAHFRSDAGEFIAMRSHEYSTSSKGMSATNFDDWPDFANKDTDTETARIAEELYLLNLGISNISYDNWFALVLKPVAGSDNVFCRVGIASGSTRRIPGGESEGGKWFRADGETRTITIV